MKKILKGFCTSFALSSFAIWLADEVFLSVAPTPQKDIKIPQKNIALFFQQPDLAPQNFKTEEVKVARLPELSQPQEDELDDAEIAQIIADSAPVMQIASVEDAADLPLEPVGTDKNVVYNGELEATPPPVTEIASKPALSPIINQPKRDGSENSQNEVTKIAMIEPDISEGADEDDDNIALSDDFETDIIPLENGYQLATNDDVEIVGNAPQNQVAMVDKQISIDTMSVEVNDAEDAPKEKEWQTMSEIDDNPWVVAKANKYAKNSQAMEDFAAEGKEDEIEKILIPEKMEDEGQNLKTAEMVKNILIPIPEDILNDENLTPQLVSPKKSLIEREDYEEDNDDEETEEASEKGKKRGFFKSIASFFSGDDGEDGADDEATLSSSRNKSGSTAKLGSGRGSSKILPAEMKLSFQPGRAEISGQTLRWVQAFANKVSEDPGTVLEIRIDKNSSYALQQRRLDLLHTILDRQGIDNSKVNTVFTSREPNSFIIRTLRIGDGKKDKLKENNVQNKTNYQTW